MSDLPSPDVLFDFSKHSLQDLQIASLDRAARHLKSAKAAWNEAVREEAIGILAAYFVEHRAELLRAAQGTLDVQTALVFPLRKRA